MKYLKLLLIFVLLLMVAPVSAQQREVKVKPSKETEVTIGSEQSEASVVAPVSAKKKKNNKSARAAKPQKVLKEPKEPKVLKPVYIFGVAASFTDSVVYYTDIQPLDSVFLNGHGFLPQRELYSYQLKNYLEYDKQIPNRTCMVYFANDRKALDKQFSKVMSKYKKASGQVLELIDPEGFRFKKPEY